MNMNEYQNYHESKSHTNIEFPYNTYLCCIPVDFNQVPLHWHEELEFIVITKGCGIISVDFHSQLVSAGDIVFVRPGQLHSIEQKEHFRMEYENILLDPAMLISGEQDLCAQQFILPLLNNHIRTETFFTPALSYYSEIASCIREIDQLCDIRPKGYQLPVKGRLFQLMYLLISNQISKKNISSARSKSLDKLKMILKYVEEHYDEPTTIDDMADLTHYSKSHFMKFFKSHMGMGFIEYLNDYRLTIAARQLVSSDESILTVASLSGFDNLSYFNRLFRRKYHTTPGAYRKKTASDE